MDKENHKYLEVFAREFYDELIAEFPTLEIEYDFPKDFMIRIPAKNEDFGDIKIWFELTETTVTLGEHFHTHFESYSFGEDISNSEMRNQIIKDTIEFISDVLSDKVLLRVVMRGEKLLRSTALWHLDESDTREYTKMVPLSGLFGKLFYKNKKITLNTWSGIYMKE